MKHLTLTFCKITASLFQQNFLSEKKKNAMVKAWTDAVKKSDTGMLSDLVTELLSLTSNEVWRQELIAARNELAGDCC